AAAAAAAIIRTIIEIPLFVFPSFDTCGDDPLNCRVSHKPRYGCLTDIEQRRDGALRVTGSEPIKRLRLLMRGEGRPTPKFNTTRPCLDTPCGGALGDPLPFPARRDPQHRDYHL